MVYDTDIYTSDSIGELITLTVLVAHMFIYYYIFKRVRGNWSCAVIGAPTLQQVF